MRAIVAESHRKRDFRGLGVSLRERNVPPSRIGGHAGRAPFSRRERDRANKRRGCACYEKDTPIARDMGEIKVYARGAECLDLLIAQSWNQQSSNARRRNINYDALIYFRVNRRRR